MSELNIDEMQAETGELLPERETLATIIIGNVGNAVAIQNHAYQSLNTASTHQSVWIAVGSFDHNHVGGGS